MALTPKQRIFVDEYMRDLNGTQAALRAHYSPNTAREQAARLLSKSNVQEAIAEQMSQRQERVRIDTDWVLKRLGSLADADMADLYDDDGALLPVKDWPEPWRRGLVAGVDVAEERDSDGNLTAVVRKVKLADRMRTLELIGRHVDVGAWRDKLDVNVTSPLAERLARARERTGQ